MIAARGPDVDGLPDLWRRSASRAIHPSTPCGDEPVVATIARGLAAGSAPWESSIRNAPAERRYELLLSTEAYDAWLIHWPVGTGLDAHDHGDSAGAFAVVSGVLEEDTVTNAGPVTRNLHEGDAVWFGVDHVHAVANRGHVAATSVHVYSPPLRTMEFYRPDSAGRLVVDRIDRVGDGEAAFISAPWRAVVEDAV